ncbi:MAG: sugar transferase [bacterium]|nr:sugar transferase [bacterium]
MVHERQYVFLRVNLLLDMVVAVGALVAAYYTRAVLAWVLEGYPQLQPGWLPDIVPYERSHLFDEYAWLFPACALVWPLVLNRFGAYDWYDLRHTAARRWIVVKASVVSVGILILAIFVFKQQFVARIVIVGTGLWAASLLLLKELIVRRVFIRLHQRPEYQHNVVVIGEGEHATRAADLIAHYYDWGLRLAATLPSDIGAHELVRALTTCGADEVVFAVPATQVGQIPPLAEVCEQLGLTTRIAVDIYRPRICKVTTEYLHGLPLLTLHPTTQNFGALTVKLFFDRVAAGLLLVVLAPLMLVIAVLIKLTSRGPVLIHQVRCGQHGKPFVLHKFRSMVAGAEGLQDELAARNELTGWAFKMSKDPRVTPLGRVLRRFSLDELPQLWNVLKGEMSLVGPRPVLPAEVEKFQLWERRRLAMKPGLTGLWQVSGRTRLPNETWVQYDLAYIDNWSLVLDVKILLKTILVIVRGEGV